eukprot:1071282-Pelagomonas_calceolata.AAC.1
MHAVSLTSGTSLVPAAARVGAWAASLRVMDTMSVRQDTASAVALEPEPEPAEALTFGRPPVDVQ